MLEKLGTLKKAVVGRLPRFAIALLCWCVVKKTCSLTKNLCIIIIEVIFDLKRIYNLGYFLTWAWSWGWTGFVRKVMVQTHLFRSSSPTLLTAQSQPLDRFKRMLNQKMRMQEMDDTGAHMPVSGTHYLWKLCSLGSPFPNDFSGCEFSPIHWAWSLPVHLYCLFIQLKNLKILTEPFQIRRKALSSSYKCVALINIGQ